MFNPLIKDCAIIFIILKIIDLDRKQHETLLFLAISDNASDKQMQTAFQLYILFLLKRTDPFRIDIGQLE